MFVTLALLQSKFSSFSSASSLIALPHMPPDKSFGRTNVDLLQGPPLVFLIRVFAGAEEELRTCFLPSLKLFWPATAAWKSAHILLVWDDETKKDHEVADKLEAEGFLDASPRLSMSNAFSPLPHHGWSVFPGKMRHSGYDRQQYANFIADLTVQGAGLTSPFVAFSDSDTVISTPVIPSSMFIMRENGTWIPRVLAYNGRSTWESATVVALGSDFPPPAVFMVVIGFPIIVHSAHLDGLRRHMVRVILKEEASVNNHTSALLAFERAYKTLLERVTLYSQFDIIGAYLWHKHRADYHWIFRDQAKVHHPAFAMRATADPVVLAADDGHGIPWIGLSRHNCHNAVGFQHIVHGPFCVASSWRGNNCTLPPPGNRPTVEDGIMSEQFVDWGDGGAGEIKQPGWQMAWRRHLNLSRELHGAEWAWL